MMKLNLMGIKNLMAISLLASSTIVLAQRNTAKSEILKVIKQQELDWNKGSITDYMNGYWKNDSLVFVGKKGPRYGWQATFDMYKTHYPADKMGKLDFSKITIGMLGKNHAQVIGHWHLSRAEDEPQGFFTLIFKKFKNDWRIISDHTE